MISVLEWGDRVASLTMLSTPNRGTSLADIAARVLPGFAEEIIDLILNLFNMDWDGIYQLSHEYVEGVFNPAVPDDPGVAYFSFHGNGGELHLILWPTFVVLRAVEGCNDGVIGCDSTRWGRDMGELPVDHWGIVGMIAGHLAFDHLAFYRDWAANLRTMGY
ncbi:MAG: hypothetical protein M5R36_05850 [Deltaproteobacteria bacterium]|nr:hypothetical protein [Deltaproteobacteria bacterium]